MQESADDSLDVSMPVWRAGAVVRVTRDIAWACKGGRITVPIGARGVVEMDAKGRPMIRFDGFAHPEFGAFPKFLSRGKPIGDDPFVLDNW